MINRGPLGDFAEEIRGRVHFDSILEDIHHALRHGCNAAVHFDNGPLRVAIRLELQIFVLKLHGNIGEHPGFGQRKEVGAHLHRQSVDLAAIRRRGHDGRGVLFARVLRQAVVARPVLVDKLNRDVVTRAIEAIAPLFKRESGNFAAALFGRPHVEAARGMGLNFIRRPPSDVNPAAVSLPAGGVGGPITLVGIRNAPIVFL